MQRRGRTASGAQRWYCCCCGKSATRKRPDRQKAAARYWFSKWLTGYRSLGDLAQLARVKPRTLQRWFEPLWVQPPLVPLATTHLCLILDATSLASRQRVILIVRSLQVVVDWQLTERENQTSWSVLCARVPAPKVAVCDGQRGLLTSIAIYWPNTLIQRCIIHVHRQALAWLTQHPQTLAGQELRQIVQALLTVRTRRQKRRFIRRFCRWQHHYQVFLGERSFGDPLPSGRLSWWYTHRKLRATRSLLANALPDLFRYIGHPEIPRTSNHLEGGVNSPLQELRYRHRGLSLPRRELLAVHYLSRRSNQKPPRNVV